MSTGFSMEKSVFSSDTIGFRGNVGYGERSSPSAVLRASFRHKMDDGSEPVFAFTMRSLPAPDVTLHSLQALALTTSDDVTGRCSGTEFWQRTADHSVHGTSDRVPSVWNGRPPSLAEHGGRVSLHHVRTGQPDG